MIAASTPIDNVTLAVKRGEKHYELSNHLGNVLATVSDKKIAVMSGANLSYYRADVVSYSDYYPFGAPMTERTAVVTPTDVRYGFNGKEVDSEINGNGNAYDFGARMYDSRLGRWWSVDPKLVDFTSWSSYNFGFCNPAHLIDPDGKEPIKPQAGTIKNFITALNNTPSRMGLSVGEQAEAALLRLGSTEWNFKPAVTPYFNLNSDRYIYTEKGGWIDMVHFLFYAGKAYEFRLQKEAAQKREDEFKKIPTKYWPATNPQDALKSQLDPVGEAVQLGYLQEMSDKLNAPWSAYSYEDLPSDKFGADFATNYFDPKSSMSLGEQINNYFDEVLKAVYPLSAPNYKCLPESDLQGESPTETNHSTNPLYTK
jgi:RHS repeat-associated protein